MDASQRRSAADRDGFVKVVEVVLTGVLVLAALSLVCAVATLCVASRLARQREQHMRHADRQNHKAAKPYRGLHEEHRSPSDKRTIAR